MVYSTYGLFKLIQCAFWLLAVSSFVPLVSALAVMRHLRQGRFTVSSVTATADVYTVQQHLVLAAALRCCIEPSAS